MVLALLEGEPLSQFKTFTASNRFPSKDCPVFISIYLPIPSDHLSQEKESTPTELSCHQMASLHGSGGIFREISSVCSPPNFWHLGRKVTFWSHPTTAPSLKSLHVPTCLKANCEWDFILLFVKDEANKSLSPCKRFEFLSKKCDKLYIVFTANKWHCCNNTSKKFKGCKDI